MAFDVFVQNPKEFFPDDGSQNRLYPIPEKKVNKHLVYDNKIQRVAAIQGNVAAVFEEWFLSYFESDYFKFVRLKSESSFKEFKSFMMDIYKKDKPFLVIDMETTEHVEDFLFGVNMVNRYNMIDPRYDTHSSKILYSIGILNTDLIELRYRRNRFRFTFDCLIMEKTLDRQLNTFTSMLMNFRSKSKFTLTRVVSNLLPLEYIHNIAISYHYDDYKSDEFLQFLNNHSEYPITRRILPNGHWQFFMEQEVHFHVDIPGIPTKDSPEMSDAFELGAQVRDSFVFEVDLPTEFLFITNEEVGTKYIPGKEYDSEKLYYIAQDAFPDLPTEWEDAILANTTKLAVDEPADNKLDVLNDIIKYISTDLYNIITAHVKMGYDINDLVYIKVYSQRYRKTPEEVSFTFSREGILELHYPDIRNLYMIGTYIHMGKINAIQHGNYTEHIGTIEKY